MVSSLLYKQNYDTPLKKVLPPKLPFLAFVALPLVQLLLDIGAVPGMQID
jgi:hypothetical protein